MSNPSDSFTAPAGGSTTPGPARNLLSPWPSLQSRIDPIARPDASTSIEMHIEEIALDGFPGIGRAELSLSVQNELSRLLEQRPLQVAPRQEERSHPRATACAPQMTAPGNNVHAVAVQLAGAIFDELSE